MSSYTQNLPPYYIDNALVVDTFCNVEVDRLSTHSNGCWYFGENVIHSYFIVIGFIGASLLSGWLFYCLTMGYLVIHPHFEIGVIERIVVSPFDDINKWIFFEKYKRNTNSVTALNDYKGPLVDVILIAEIIAGKIFYDLRSYLMGIGTAVKDLQL